MTHTFPDVLPLIGAAFVLFAAGVLGLAFLLSRRTPPPGSNGRFARG